MVGAVDTPEGCNARLLLVHSGSAGVTRPSARDSTVPTRPPEAAIRLAARAVNTSVGRLRPIREDVVKHLPLEVVVVDEDLDDQPGQHDDAAGDDPTSGMWHLSSPGESSQW